MEAARTKLIHELRKAIADPMHANHCEVPKLLAEKAIFEIERLMDENAQLREGLSWIECEPLNAEYMARNILDGLHPHDLRRDDETTEQFVLGYVKRIESSLRNRPTCTNSQTATWRNVASDGPPPCNGEEWFLGANDQGAMCCFNFLDDTGMCWYCGPEDNAQLMDGLLWWAKVDAPDMTISA